MYRLPWTCRKRARVSSIPMLGGQKAEYVVTSLIAYQTGERAIDEHGKIMQGIASRLTIEEIRAVANYVSGLY